MSDSPNLAAFAWSIAGSLLRIRRPRSSGTEVWDHSAFEEPLKRLEQEGVASLDETETSLRAYLEQASTARPDHLGRAEGLAFWINVYNAGALVLAAETRRSGEGSVLRVPAGFRRPVVTIDGEGLSLDAIEHAKVRRFGDPRIHAGLVCGSVSCPTLRPMPYRGADLDLTLDDQLRSLLAEGAAIADPASGRLSLSRIFRWYGADFVRPGHMPSFAPVSGRRVAAALVPWLDSSTAAWWDETMPKVDFMEYDWGLACRVA